jgi:hypothetical protein
MGSASAPPLPSRWEICRFNSFLQKKYSIFNFQFSIFNILLVQRCNGTIAGLGYLEVNVICPCSRLKSVRTVDPPWGE